MKTTNYSTMASLELPIDIIWEGNLMPLSPSQLSTASAEEVLIFENSFANGKKKLFLKQTHAQNRIRENDKTVLIIVFCFSFFEDIVDEIGLLKTDQDNFNFKMEDETFIQLLELQNEVMDDDSMSDFSDGE